MHSCMRAAGTFCWMKTVFDHGSTAAFFLAITRIRVWSQYIPHVRMSHVMLRQHYCGEMTMTSIDMQSRGKSPLLRRAAGLENIAG